MTGYEVTTAHVPAYAGAGLPAAEVARILHGLNPAALQEAGAAHTALGRELDTMAAQLTQESQTLAQHWSGAAARRAQAQFQQLHTQTATLAAQATRTGSVLTWLGTQVVPAFRDPSDAGQAQQYLTSLSAALVRANGALPPEIGGSGTAQLASATPGPAPNSPASPSPANPGSPGNLAYGNATPSNLASLSTPNSPIQPGSPTAPGDLATTTGPANLMSTSTTSGSPANPTGPGSPASPATTVGPAQPAPLASRLQSAAPAPSAQPVRTPPEATDPAPAPAGVAEAPAPLISSVTARPTRAKQPAPAGPVDQDSGLSGGALPLQPPADPASPAALAATPAPATHNTLGALPMAGGVSSQSDHERHRESWAPEDRNPWGLPDICVPPLIEGS
ncbi:MAG TPA: hypothetical protein VH089_12505 [Streptosporangiaceae bacterium]|nr:hypothetical protein [Streptosporangiaceae bacterium]